MNTTNRLKFYRIVAKIKRFCQGKSRKYQDVGNINRYVCAVNKSHAFNLIRDNLRDLSLKGHKIAKLTVERDFSFTQWQSIERSCSVIIEDAIKYREFARKQMMIMERREKLLETQRIERERVKSEQGNFPVSKHSAQFHGAFVTQ